MAELTDNERRDIERKLHRPKWRARLQRLQNTIQQEFEKFRDQAEILVIRTVIPRIQIKELPSVIKKIKKNRETDPHYWLYDIEDLIGIKVLCPYLTDVKDVIKWMRAHPGFRVNPESDEKARRQKNHGYRGYHFTVELKDPLILTNEDLMGLKCEVQLKTMLEEAWDAKTHEVTYRREEQISPKLLKEMRSVSDELVVVDEKTENLRELILQQEAQEREKKEAVVAVYLNEAMVLVQEIIIEVPNGQELLKGKFTATNVLELVQVIQKYREERKLSTNLCLLAALVGVYAIGKYADEWALDICDELIRQEPNNPRAYLTKGSVCWALDLLDDALELTQAYIDKVKDQGNDNMIAEGKGNFAYWVAEKACSGMELEAHLLARAKDYIGDAIRMQPNDPSYLDTKGFLLITTGSTKDEIEEGRDLINKARKKSAGTPFDKISAAFYRRHDRIALVRLEGF